MAENVIKNEKKGLSKGWKLAIIGFAILLAGLLAFGGAFVLGFLTLARDLLATAVVAEGLYVGGIGAVGAINAINNKRNQSKSNSRQLERAREQEQELSQDMEEIPVEEISFDKEPIVIEENDKSKINSKNKSL